MPSSTSIAACTFCFRDKLQSAQRPVVRPLLHRVQKPAALSASDESFFQKHFHRFQNSNALTLYPANHVPDETIFDRTAESRKGPAGSSPGGTTSMCAVRMSAAEKHHFLPGIQKTVAIDHCFIQQRIGKRKRSVYEIFNSRKAVLSEGMFLLPVKWFKTNALPNVR